MIYVGWGNKAYDYVVWKFYDGWTHNDYKQAVEQTALLLSEAGNVPLLVDVRRIQSDTSDTIIIDELHWHDLAIKHVVLIGKPGSLQSVHKSISPLFAGDNVQLELVDDVDLAYSLIARYRANAANNQDG